MKSPANLFGHPIHPILIALPLGLLPAALLCDLTYFLTRREFWAEMAYWLIAGGIVGGLLAAVFGTIDWLGIPKHTRARSIGALHGLLNVLVIAAFIVSWLMRHADPLHPSALAAIIGLLALFLAGISGWLGGELVYRLGMGVHSDAHLDAK